MKPVALITGASGGIGRQLSKSYLEKGYAVILTDVDPADLERLSGSLATEFDRESFHIVPADLRNPQDISAMIQSGKDRYGRIDVLINNAGFGITKIPYELTWEEWDSVLNTNLRGAFLCSREAASVMRNQPEGGSIVHIASTRAMMSEPHTEAYAASKGGLLALTHALAASLAPDRITVNCISPGWIETGDYTQLREEDHQQHWSGRVGRPEDVARACLYLTDPTNDFVTGANIVVDGGMTKKMIYEE
ncbi:SDR family NAD(P)-dependent oxidoreductase [Paenibacillus abyssi]|uniref:Oxidoreductase n=1 Tax=Paenibacillus abyssi TaxID=1340531 RepID=A0A917CLG1_9BACL|nr:SDR family oxidoreductase [Paenibacillus abyssi]GGF90131.1 oxidoreductase [Paenibacillus abyssi]